MTDVVLQQRDSDVLQALCEDRAECGRGLTWADLEHAGRTRWVHHILRRLAKAGHAIASTGRRGEFNALGGAGLDADRQQFLADFCVCHHLGERGVEACDDLFRSGPQFRISSR